jgi:hypothetical protein
VQAQQLDTGAKATREYIRRLVCRAVINDYDLNVAGLLTQGAFDRLAYNVNPIPGWDYNR